jgi:hypothetical protein
MLARLFDHAHKPGPKNLPFPALEVPQIAHFGENVRRRNRDLELGHEALQQTEVFDRICLRSSENIRNSLKSQGRKTGQITAGGKAGHAHFHRHGWPAQPAMSVSLEIQDPVLVRSADQVQE